MHGELEALALAAGAGGFALSRALVFLAPRAGELTRDEASQERIMGMILRSEGRAA